jgi:hypothetical protein
MRKANEDPIARTVAEHELADTLGRTGMPIGNSEGGPMSASKELVGAFKAVEFETTSRKVGDDEVKLRRLVITGPWEVDPNAG